MTPTVEIERRRRTVVRSESRPHVESAPRRARSTLAQSAWIWGSSIAWSTPVLGSLTVLQSFFPSDRLEWLSRLYCWGQTRILARQWRAVVHPAVHNSRPYMFCQNHTNHFDHCMLYNATPHFKQGVERADHFKIPLYGWFMKSRGTIPVQPGGGGQAPEIMAHMQNEIDRGHSILAFPEGTRTRDGRVGTFRKGVFFIARDLGLPIVPVAVVGMYDVMNRHSLRISRGNEVTVYCEEPIETKGLRDADIPALAARVQDVVASRVEQSRARMPRTPTRWSVA